AAGRPGAAQLRACRVLLRHGQRDQTWPQSTCGPKRWKRPAFSSPPGYPAKIREGGRKPPPADRSSVRCFLGRNAGAVGCTFRLGIAIDKFDHRHRGHVAITETSLQDPAIAALTFLVT